MKMVGVCACTVGIAHTYIAQEKLEKQHTREEWPSLEMQKQHMKHGNSYTA